MAEDWNELQELILILHCLNKFSKEKLMNIQYFL